MTEAQKRLTHFEHYYNNGVMMIHGDCMDVMAEIGEKEIPIAIVDPQYGIGRDGSKRTTSRHGGRKAHEFKGWDKSPPDQKYFNELFRVSKNQIIWGANYFTQFLPASMGWIFWDKGQRICNSDGEMAFSSFNQALRVVEINRVELLIEGTIHPTQKPVALYKWLLSRYSHTGELILDTHGGSGSICIACHDLGHPIIWVEKDADYYRDAVKRVKTHQAQETLFSASAVAPVQLTMDTFDE